VTVGLRLGADVICEKPLVVEPRQLDAIETLEQETGKHVYTVLQLRLHPALVALKRRLVLDLRHHEVELTYVAARGHWYDVSWKGLPARSGGIAMNIGIHLFDLLLWLFGDVQASEVHLADPRRMAGRLTLAHANVRWLLSTEAADLPPAAAERQKTAYRSIVVDGEPLEFTDGVADLHTRVYEEVLGGRGLGVAEARRSIELVDRIRSSSVRASRAAIRMGAAAR
jgi:UDP-N-acetyl-2-amino-2-deoxyglucuronate dehydrogenase